MSAFVAALESFSQFLVKKSEGLFLIFILVVIVWFVTSEWNGMNNRVGNLETRMENLEVRLDNVEIRLAKVEADIASLDKRLAVLEVKVDALTAEVQEMKGDIKTILTILTTKKN